MVKIHVHDAEHWITVHPNGNKEEKGTPLLIEGSNGHYVVKGGAGGKLNGKQVTPKSMSKARAGTEGGEQPKGEEPKGETPKVETPQPKAEEPAKAAQPVMWKQLENHLMEKHGIYENELLEKIKQESKHVQQGSWAGQYDLTKGEQLAQAEREKRGIKPYGSFEFPEGHTNMRRGSGAEQIVSHTNPDVPEVKFPNYTEAREYSNELQKAKDPVAFAKETLANQQAAYGKPAAVKFIADIGNGKAMYEAMGANRRYTLELSKSQIEKGYGEVAEKFLAENANKMQRYMPQSVADACPTKEMFAARLEMERLTDLRDKAEGKEREDLKQQIKDGFERIDEMRLKAAGKHGEALLKRKAEAAARKELQSKVTKREAFAPQKTAEAASEWAIKNNLADNVNYGYLSADVANEANKALHYYVENYPELRPFMRAYGSCQFIKKDQYEESRAVHAVSLAASGYDDKDLERQLRKDVKMGSVGSNTWAFASVNMLGFNEKYGDDAAKEKMEASMKRCVETKWHPEGCDTIKSIYDHEFGHKLDFMVGGSNDPEMLKLYRSEKRKKSIKDNLSEYGNKNIAEFIAEGWTEAINNPNARPTSKKIESIIKRLYADYRKANPAAAA